MEMFLFALAGCLSAAGLFAMGFFCAWKTRPAVERFLRSDAPEESVPAADEQLAFQRLQNYTAADAYGLSDHV